MKKQELKDAVWRAESRAQGLSAEVARLRAEVENMRRHWRPTPISHPWTPRDSQCALCDEPRDAERHEQ